LNINIEKGGTNMDETDQEYLDEYLLHYGIWNKKIKFILNIIIFWLHIFGWKLRWLWWFGSFLDGFWTWEKRPQ
jgi:hypothetical protein